jgi:hypothetical protein
MTFTLLLRLSQFCVNRNFLTKYTDYDLSKVPNGYQLARDHDREKEAICQGSPLAAT